MGGAPEYRNIGDWVDEDTLSDDRWFLAPSGASTRQVLVSLPEPAPEIWTGR
jgi:hypothetical protein